MRAWRCECSKAHWFSLAILTLSVGLASPAPFRPDRILVKPKAGTDPAALRQFHAREQTDVMRTFTHLGNLQVVRLAREDARPPNSRERSGSWEGEGRREPVQATIINYQRSGLVDFAEPDYLIELAATEPNDPAYADGTLWALHNGATDADIDAPEAWDLSTSASSIVAALIDTGVRYTHEDLASNMWRHPEDGSHGWNALTGTNDPYDDSGHGTML